MSCDCDKPKDAAPKRKTRDVHVYLHRGRTRDADTKHDPKNGQFTSGGGGSSGSRPKSGPALAKHLTKHNSAMLQAHGFDLSKPDDLPDDWTPPAHFMAKLDK